MQENPPFFPRLGEAHGLHQCVAGGGSIARGFGIHMQRIEAHGAVVAATAVVFWDECTTFSALKSVVSNCKIHVRSLAHHALMDNTYQAPRGRLLPTLVVFLFVGGLLYGLFLVFERHQLQNSLTSIQENKDKLQQQIEVLKDDQIAQLYTAQQTQKKSEESIVRWSKIMTNLQNLVPVSVFVSSYGVNEDGTLQLSGVSDGLGSVADFIRVLDDSQDFNAPFVPTLSAGVTTDGQAVVSFSLAVQALIN